MEREQAKTHRRVLGANIRKARMRMGITQAQLAELLEMSPEVYGRMERGHIYPRVERLMDICEKLGVSSDGLMGLSPSETLQPVTGAIPGYDELLSVVHGFMPIMPRLSQVQHLALRRHMVGFQRFVLALLDEKQAPRTKRRKPREGPPTP
jgi:transcriptional regulator with XRE-family HTH domain